MTKFGGTTMGGSPQTRTPILNCLSQMLEIFRLGKYEKKIKLDKTWKYHNGGPLRIGSPKVKKIIHLS